ncbi:MAG: TetR/AcrR family transcriptional regulator [Planctomycetota bacterium]
MSKIQRASGRPRASLDPDLHPRKSERTRTAILDAALELLWSQPFRDLTVAEVMSLAGASRSAFYSYFEDLHDLMEDLLRRMGEDVFEATSPWFQGSGDPVAALRESLRGLVRIGYERGPILRAVADASTTDERLECAWTAFVASFDDAVTSRIEEHQAKKLIPAFDARPVAVALNQLDASMLIHAFGRRPRGDPEAVYGALDRIWSSTLYESTARRVRGRNDE